MEEEVVTGAVSISTLNDVYITSDTAYSIAISQMIVFVGLFIVFIFIKLFKNV